MSSKIFVNSDPTIVGYVAQDVPASLKNLLPGYTFLQTQGQPGVYILYNERNGRAYIGESKNVTFECSMYLTGQRTKINPEFEEDIKNYRNEFKRYALHLGPGCADQGVRINLERAILAKIGAICYNIKDNPFTTRPTAPRPTTTSVQIRYEVGSLLQKYGLDYTGLPMSFGGVGCIYLFIHPVSKRFYIGETANGLSPRIKGHLDNLNYLVKSAPNPNIAPKLQNIYKDVASDVMTKEATLVFSILETVPFSASKEERTSLELKYQKEASLKYGDRLYNKLNTGTTNKTFKKTAEARQLIREASIGVPKNTEDNLAYPVIIDGVFYGSIAQASSALGYTYKDGPKKRCLSPKFPTYIWLKYPSGKQIPMTPEIQKKLNYFLKYRDAVLVSGRIPRQTPNYDSIL